MFFDFLNIVFLKIGSPLEQFGSDEDSFCRSDRLDISEILVVSISSFASWFIEDDDVDVSSFDEDEIVSDTQSFIFINNLVGMLPGFDTATSEVVLTFFLSIHTLIYIVLTGFILHICRYFGILLPSGTPLLMILFIIIIEFVSFLARAFSLGMRLFANMFAGHSLLKIITSFMWVALNSNLFFFALPVYLLLIIIFLLELGIAYLQSYVFAILSSLYLEQTICFEH